MDIENIFRENLLKYRAESVARNGAPAKKADEEFGVDYSDAYAAALRENRGDKLTEQEKIDLENYRHFRNDLLTPNQLRTLVYLQGRLDQGYELSEEQHSLLEDYKFAAGAGEKQVQDRTKIQDALHKSD